MGAQGLREVNRRGADGAHYLADKITAGGKASLTFPEKPYLNEFCLTTKANANDIVAAALKEGILAGVAIAPDRLLIAVTEMQTVDEMDHLAKIINSL